MRGWSGDCDLAVLNMRLKFSKEKLLTEQKTPLLSSLMVFPDNTEVIFYDIMLSVDSLRLPWRKSKKLSIRLT